MSSKKAATTDTGAVSSARKGRAKPEKYRGYTIREKFWPSLLLALFAPFTVFFFGPFEVFGNNMSQFKFLLKDFLPLCLLTAFTVAIVLFDILLLLRSRVYDIVFGLVFGGSLMLFVQGNYLSLGVSSLAGDGAGDSGFTVPTLAVNAAVWILVILGCVLAMLLLYRYRDTVRTVATVALVALVGMSLISFAAVSLSTDVYAAEYGTVNGGEDIEKQMLTVRNLDTLAREDNVVIFIVDRFDWEYYYWSLDKCPEIFDELEGFTYFNDYITLYPRTFPGVPHVLTGVENDFSESRLKYFERAYTESPYLAAIREAGYDINVYTDDYYGYKDARDLSGYAENTSGNVSYDIVEQNKLSLDMIRLSLYRYLPFSLTDTLGDISTPTFNQYVSYNSELPVYSTDMKDVYEALTEDDFTFRASKKGFSFIHIAGCHLPNRYNADFEPATGSDRTSAVVGMKQSFKIISEYLKEMKRMGVYEDATVIITGDHCSIGSDSKDPYYPHITSLLAKPAGVSEGAIAQTNAQVTPDEIFSTVLHAVGSPLAEEYGPTLFEVPDGVDRPRRYLFQRKLSDGTYENVEYRIEGYGHDLDNWQIVSRTDLGKSIYD